MSRRAPIRLPPSHIDLAIARFCARQAFPGEERTLRALTVLADEKTVVAGALLYWAYSRLDAVAPAGKREADRMACAVLVASALPHVLKHLFDRQRPDRSVMRGRRRRGIPRSGEPYDSFPSGHAINIGAIAGPLARLVPPHLRPAVWPVLTLLAASRVLLLAHYPSDVAAGLVLGTFIERVTDQLAPRQVREAKQLLLSPKRTLRRARHSVAYSRERPASTVQFR
jgi:membrane-associated phospholipid phosphatase